MTLGKRIGRLRKERKLSQEYVAESLNVTRQAVSKWENDLSSPDTDNLIALAKLLDVDVDFLASGELTVEMVSDPIPEPPKPPKPEKPKRSRKKLMILLLIGSLCANMLLGFLWIREKNDRSDMEQFAAQAAYAAKDSFANFVHYGTEGYYWQGVAEYRRFMQTYLVLHDGVGSGEYAFLNELYAYLIWEPERVHPYMEELRRAMRLLNEDVYDYNAYLEIVKLNNLIQYGE